MSYWSLHRKDFRLDYPYMHKSNFCVREKVESNFVSFLLILWQECSYLPNISDVGTRLSIKSVPLFCTSIHGFKFWRVQRKLMEEVGFTTTRSVHLRTFWHIVRLLYAMIVEVRQMTWVVIVNPILTCRSSCLSIVVMFRLETLVSVHDFHLQYSSQLGNEWLL